MANDGTKIPTLKLNDGTSIPLLGYGTGTAMYKSTDDGKLDRVRVEQIKTAIKAGFYHLDGAEMYNTEAELGVAIKESKVDREKLFVTSKVYRNVKNIAGAIDASLKQLQLDYVDLYLIHTPFWANNDTELQEAWREMEAVKESGKARSIGVSNYLEKHIEATLKTATITPSINQTEFHLYLQRGNLLQYLHSKGIAASAYGPITPVTKGKPGPCDALLAEVAKKYGVDESEICLRWCLDQGVVAITTSSKEDRLNGYLRVNSFRLTPKEIENLSKAGLEKHVRAFMKNYFDPNDRS